MGKRQVELPTYNCTYCGYEALQLNQIRSQSGSERFICGDCMIKAFDEALNYEPGAVRQPEVSEPSPEGPPADTDPAEQK